VANDGPTLLIGAPYLDIGDWEGVGGAYVFDWMGSSWVERQSLVNSGYVVEERTGSRVGLAGSTLVLTTPAELYTPGTFHLYSYSGSRWIQHLKLTSQGGVGCCTTGVQLHDGLGRSLAVEQRRLVVGAPFADPGSGLRAGAAYVFDFDMQDPRPTFYCSPKKDSQGCVPRIYHYGVPSVSGALSGEGYQVRGWELLPHQPGLLLYSTTGAASTPFGGGRLCLQPPVKRTPQAITGANGMPCNGQFSFDFNAWIAGGNDPSLTAGQPVWMQYWYRDPGGPPGQTVGLTAGLFVEICP
jgi:hypothetical protein